MTFFSNPNRGTVPPSYGQYGRQNPYRQQRYYDTQPNPYRQQQYYDTRSNSFGSRQRDYLGPMNPNSRWEQDFTPYNWQQQPYYNPNDRQQPFANQNGSQEQQFNPYNRQQQGRPSLMDGLNTLMGHADTLSNGVNMMRQMGSILGFLR